MSCVCAGTRRVCSDIFVARERARSTQFLMALRSARQGRELAQLSETSDVAIMGLTLDLTSVKGHADFLRPA